MARVGARGTGDRASVYLPSIKYKQGWDKGGLVPVHREYKHGAISLHQASTLQTYTVQAPCKRFPQANILSALCKRLHHAYMACFM